jgi:hypothetical protein
VQNVQERLPLAGQYIFIRVPNEIELLGTEPFSARVHRTLPSVRRLDDSHMSLRVERHSSDLTRNGQDAFS